MQNENKLLSDANELTPIIGLLHSNWDNLSKEAGNIISHLKALNYHISCQENLSHFTDTHSIPDCLLALPKSTKDLEALLKDRSPNINLPPMIVIPLHSRPGTKIAVTSFHQGAIDVLRRTVEKDALQHSIANAMPPYWRHQRVLRTRVALLSPREKDVLSLIVRAYTRKMIGETLGISIKTTDVHIARILKKTDVMSMNQFSYWALKYRVFHPNKPPLLNKNYPLDATEDIDVTHPIKRTLCEMEASLTEKLSWENTTLTEYKPNQNTPHTCTKTHKSPASPS